MWYTFFDITLIWSCNMRRIKVPSPTLYLFVIDETLVIDLFRGCRYEWGDLRQQDEIPSQVTQENGSMWLECFLTIRVQRFCQPQTVQLCLQPWLPPPLPLTNPYQLLPESRIYYWTQLFSGDPLGISWSICLRVILTTIHYPRVIVL